MTDPLYDFSNRYEQTATGPLGGSTWRDTATHEVVRRDNMGNVSREDGFGWMNA